MSVTPIKAGTRPPIVDGLFYPAKPGALAATIDDLLARSPTPQGSSFAVISPHAGYEYAGPVMAAAFQAVALRPVRTAVLIGPVHRDPEQHIYLPESNAFATPLGDIPVDVEAVRQLLAADPLFQRNDIPHLEEHCLELQLPFLARLFPGLSIVPMLVGSGDARTTAALVRALRLTFAGRARYTAFVMSANMASYMTGRDTESENTTLEALLAGCDWKGVLGASETGRISACGPAGIAALLALAGPECKVRILARSSSRNTEPGTEHTVHYAAVSVEGGDFSSE
jgi:MEMO1 family protein